MIEQMNPIQDSWEWRRAMFANAKTYKTCLGVATTRTHLSWTDSQNLQDMRGREQVELWMEQMYDGGGSGSD
jgi:hypothetical protein